MNDPTEATRRALVGAINADPGSREALEAAHGAVYDTGEVQAAFRIEAFCAPLVVCTRLADGARGTLWFQHSPRFFWGFEAVRA